MPYEAYCLTPTGEGVPCCSFQNAHDIDNLIQPHNNKIFNLPVFQHLQDVMDEGDIPPYPYCNNCLKKEASGGKSYRMMYERNRQKIDVPFEKNVLRHLDISFSNTCNLSCIMCSNIFSSKWNSIQKLFPAELADKKGNKPGNFTHTLTKKQIDEILEKCDNLITCSIKGGEPLYDKKTLYFLEKLARINSKVRIKINSNVTVPNIPLLKKFKNIELFASIDGIHKTYEYIRGWHDFKIISNNIEDLIKNDIPVRIVYTVSAWNLHNLKDTQTYFSNLGVIDTSAMTAGGWAVHYDLLGRERRDELINNLDLASLNFEVPFFMDRSILEIKEWKQTTEIMNKQRGINWEDIVNV